MPTARGLLSMATYRGTAGPVRPRQRGELDTEVRDPGDRPDQPGDLPRAGRDQRQRGGGPVYSVGDRDHDPLLGGGRSPRWSTFGAPRFGRGARRWVRVILPAIGAPDPDPGGHPGGLPDGRSRNRFRRIASRRRHRIRRRVFGLALGVVLMIVGTSRPRPSSAARPCPGSGPNPRRTADRRAQPAPAAATTPWRPTSRRRARAQAGAPASLICGRAQHRAVGPITTIGRSIGRLTAGGGGVADGGDPVVAVLCTSRWPEQQAQSAAAPARITSAPRIAGTSKLAAGVSCLRFGMAPNGFGRATARPVAVAGHQTAAQVTGEIRAPPVRSPASWPAP